MDDFHWFLTYGIILFLLIWIRSLQKSVAKHLTRADEGWQHAENEHQRAVLLECKCNKLIGEKANLQLVNQGLNKAGAELMVENARLCARLKKAHR